MVHASCHNNPQALLCRRKLNCIFLRRSTVCINNIIYCRLGAEYLQMLRTFPLFTLHSLDRASWRIIIQIFFLPTAETDAGGQTPLPFLEECT